MREPAAELRRRAEQLEASFQGPAWHGPSVREALAGVTAAQAFARPIPGAHSIWELVLHLQGGYRLVLRRLEGDTRNLSPEEDWPPASSAPDEVAWQAAQTAVAELNRRTQAAVRSFDPGALDRPLIPDPPYSAFVQFAGLPQHDLYHAGQIVLLRRALGVG